MTNLLKMNVRLLNSQDAKIWHELRLHGLQTDPSAFASSYEEEITNSISDIQNRFDKFWSQKDNFILGCFIGQQLISVAGLFPETHLKRKHIATVWGVYTHPDHRGVGAASLVIDELVNLVRKHTQIKRVALSVEASNLPAIKLYEKFGFCSWGIEPESLIVQGTCYDESYMSLKI